MKLGYTLLYVDNVKNTMDFYCNAFSMQPGFLHESNQYGEMLTGETKLGFVDHAIASTHGFEYDKMSLTAKAQSFEIALVADDVEQAFKIAVEAGAVPVAKPATMPWGQIVAYVRDCNGFTIEICSPIN